MNEPRREAIQRKIHLPRRLIAVTALVAAGIAPFALSSSAPDRRAALVERPGADRDTGERAEKFPGRFRARGGFDRQAALNAVKMIQDGRRIFRFDTFGDEDFWGGALRLHEGVELVSPREALAVGLKVDSEALPRELVRALREGEVDLDDPAVTLVLLRLDAVLGVTGFFDEDEDGLSSIGIQCALCHSTVDDSLAPGIGKRLDGWPNQDLNVGAVVDLSPDLSPVAELLGTDEETVRAAVRSWGPGKFDASLFVDGKAFREGDQGDRSAAVLIPPAFGLAGVNLHTWTGWGSVSHWNAFVANLEMHGKGTFIDPRLNDMDKFPVAAMNGLYEVRNDPDLITPKLAALQFYQLSLPAPSPPEGSFDPEAAERGKVLFDGKAECSSCHVPPLFTEPGWNLHTPEELGIDAFQAERSPEEAYRTAPLKGLWTHTERGFYHDGRFPTLGGVVDHYDDAFSLGLTEQEKADLVEYLLSL